MCATVVSTLAATGPAWSGRPDGSQRLATMHLRPRSRQPARDSQASPTPTLARLGWTADTYAQRAIPGSDRPLPDPRQVCRAAGPPDRKSSLPGRTSSGNTPAAGRNQSRGQLLVQVAGVEQVAQIGKLLIEH